MARHALCALVCSLTWASSGVAVKNLGVSLTNLLAVDSQPLFSVFLSYVILGEKLNLWQAARGMSVITDLFLELLKQETKARNVIKHVYF